MNKKESSVNLNTILLTAVIGLVGFFGNRIISVVDADHDVTITHTSTIANHELRITAVETGQTTTEKKLPSFITWAQLDGIRQRVGGVSVTNRPMSPVVPEN